MRDHQFVSSAQPQFIAEEPIKIYDLFLSGRSLDLGSAIRKLDELEQSFEATQVYCRQLSNMSQLLRTKTATLHQMLRHLKSGTTFGLVQELENSFDRIAEDWDVMQHHDIEFEIEPMMSFVSKFLAALKTCVDNIELIFNARKIQFDRLRMQGFVDEAKQLFDSRDVKPFDSIFIDQKIDLDNLLECFAPVLQHIMIELYQMKPLNANVLVAKANKLSKIAAKLNGMVVRLHSTEFNDTQAIADVDPTRSDDHFSNLKARIRSMLINTPRIVDSRLRQPVPLKRPRIFSVEQSPSRELAIGAGNMSSMSEDGCNVSDLQPASKRFCSSEFTSDSLAPVSVSALSNQSRQLIKTNAIEMLKNIQLKRSVEPLKSLRRSMMPKSQTPAIPIPDCQSIHAKVLEMVEQTPRAPLTVDASNKFFIEKISTVGPMNISPVDALKSTRNRKRLSLDGA